MNGVGLHVKRRPDVLYVCTSHRPNDQTLSVKENKHLIVNTQMMHDILIECDLWDTNYVGFSAYNTFINTLVNAIIQLSGNTLKHSMATTVQRLITFSKF